MMRVKPIISKRCYVYIYEYSVGKKKEEELKVFTENCKVFEFPRYDRLYARTGKIVAFSQQKACLHFRIFREKEMIWYSVLNIQVF